MSADSDPLCCCEYFDIEQQRNHILACCCNCQDLDESFESFVMGKGIPSHRARGCVATLKDRLRIPWNGGARQVALDTILPVLLLPTLLLLASISIWWTVSMFSLMFLLLFYASFFKASNFFVAWLITSWVILYLIFEFLVVPFLEILLHENILLTVSMCACIACIYVTKMRTYHLKSLENEVESGHCKRVPSERTRYCSICQITVPEKDHHCVWINCCIGHHNRCVFLVAILVAIFVLLYGSNLAITSVCHPYHVYKTILLPDDCSDVYELYETGLSFVCGIYGLVIACVLGIFLLHEILLISLGLTSQEWRELPFSSKLCCAITAHRPNNKGCISNWFRISCYCQKYPNVTYQY